MSYLNKYKIAFIGWNPFQFLHIYDLAKEIPNSVFILEKRSNNNQKYFSNELLQNTKVPIIQINSQKLLEIDNQYDILIVQTYFYPLEKFKHSKIVMLQYGYAKEPHNYGVWRAIATLNITYGDYARKKILPYSPSIATGNPRYDKWKTKSFHHKVKKKYNLPFKHTQTILYMPTWGDLSSFSLYIQKILELQKNFNILLKIHHNTDFFEKKTIKQKENIYLFGANYDNIELLALADIVISDYSGAIFDAFYCKKRIILLNLPKKVLQKSLKIDPYSIELHQRELLGESIQSPQNFHQEFQTILEKPFTFNKKSNELYQELFKETNQASKNFIIALYKLMQGEYKQTQSQKYIQQYIITSYNKQCISDIIINKLKSIYKFLKH
jgi:hypothetical protein